MQRRAWGDALGAARLQLTVACASDRLPTRKGELPSIRLRHTIAYASDRRQMVSLSGYVTRTTAPATTNQTPSPGYATRAPTPAVNGEGHPSRGSASWEFGYPLWREIAMESGYSARLPMPATRFLSESHATTSHERLRLP